VDVFLGHSVDAAIRLHVILSLRHSLAPFACRLRQEAATAPGRRRVMISLNGRRERSPEFEPNPSEYRR